MHGSDDRDREAGLCSRAADDRQGRSPASCVQQVGELCRHCGRSDESLKQNAGRGKEARSRSRLRAVSHARQSARSGLSQRSRRRARQVLEFLLFNALSQPALELRNQQSLPRESFVVHHIFAARSYGLRLVNYLARPRVVPLRLPVLYDLPVLTLTVLQLPEVVVHTLHREGRGATRVRWFLGCRGREGRKGFFERMVRRG
jgi:hypothetical protein